MPVLGKEGLRKSVPGFSEHLLPHQWTIPSREVKEDQPLNSGTLSEERHLGRDHVVVLLSQGQVIVTILAFTYHYPASLQHWHEPFYSGGIQAKIGQIGH
jgi:hypothetical protein